MRLPPRPPLANLAGKGPASYLAEDTIAALATATGGPVALVRISGPRAFEALRALTHDDKLSEPRHLTRAALQNQDGVPLDESLFVRFTAPHSFTGEDVVELHLHGGTYIAVRVLETLSSLGVRQALPGEFSFRAVRNGKMTISQAQAAADLIAASNDGAVALAIEKMSGSQSRLLSEMAESLRHLCALVEASIDFADQDIEELSLSALKRRLTPVVTSLGRLRDGYGRGSRLQDGIRVAFVGAPNAGKSSFFNAILGEDRSIVSEIPGTTRDVIRERLTLRGRRSTVTLRLEDTAGLRATDNKIERLGIERSKESVRNADLVMLIVDPTSPIAPVIEQWHTLGELEQKTLGIFTKCDLLSDFSDPAVDDDFSSLPINQWVRTSSLTGRGINEAVDLITEFCERLLARDPGEVLLTRLDQFNAVSIALDHLVRAGNACAADLFAADLRHSLHCLGPLIGETLADDLLERIFSKFCIGK